MHIQKLENLGILQSMRERGGLPNHMGIDCGLPQEFVWDSSRFVLMLNWKS